MSAADYKRYREDVYFFIYKRMRVIGATNSLKLQKYTLAGRGKPYIWMDPDWCLLKDKAWVLSSRTYPRHRHPAYLSRHREWMKVLHSIDGHLLLNVSLRFDGVSVFRFSGGLELLSFPRRADEE